MATYYSNIYGTTIRPDEAGTGRVVTAAGCLTIPSGKVIATGDVLKLFKVGSGGHVRNIWIQNTDFGTDVPGKVGHYGVDDGVALDDDSITTDILLETAADRNFENYASYQPVSEYEVGSAYGVRFILTPHLTADAGVGSATTNGMRSTSSAVDVYTLVIFGADSYGSVALKGMNSVQVKGRKPEMLTPGDALGQRGEIAWKFYHANTILNDNWIANIRTAATQL